MGRTLLLTGRPGVGKTTVLRKVVEQLGNRCGGFYTDEIRGPRGRLGFCLVTLCGKAAVMAHVNLRRPGRPRVSRYGVDVAVVEEVGVAALYDAMQRHQVLVIDEIGKMELFSDLFRTAVLEAAAGPYTVLATAMRDPHPWVDAFKAREDVELWHVTLNNRGELPQQIVSWIEQLAPV